MAGPPPLLLLLLLAQLLAPAKMAAALSPPAGGLPESSTALPSELQLSNQTREWWRWVLVRVTGFVEFVNTDEDREEFVREWNPDLFEWAGDYRMNVNEWARLHGIAMAAGQELEYEEAQFWFNAAEPNIVNTTWGSDGLNVNVNGELMTEGTFAPYLLRGEYYAYPNQFPVSTWKLGIDYGSKLCDYGSKLCIHSPRSRYMTHVAPKWHVAVEQGNSRHGRAGMADSMAQVGFPSFSVIFSRKCRNCPLFRAFK